MKKKRKKARPPLRVGAPHLPKNQDRGSFGAAKLGAQRSLLRSLG